VGYIVRSCLKKKKKKRRQKKRKKHRLHTSFVSILRRYKVPSHPLPGARLDESLQEPVVKKRIREI
jgi:hypothetical protein